MNCIQRLSSIQKQGTDENEEENEINVQYSTSL